jgi:predicted ribonuclease YlaK
MNAGVYVTEAQNSSIDMMKLILQRIGDDSICVIEGDDIAQVDMKDYIGENNGLRRLSEVFRDHDFYGEVTLPIIHRSKIAELAEKM